MNWYKRAQAEIDWETSENPTREIFRRDEQKNFLHPIGLQMRQDTQSIWQDWEGRQLETDCKGSWSNCQTELDMMFDKRASGLYKQARQKLYHAYDASRAMLKQEFGPVVRLFRAQGRDVIGAKNTLRYADRGFAKKFLNPRNRMTAKDILVDDILVMLLTEWGYREFIVLNRESVTAVHPLEEQT